MEITETTDAKKVRLGAAEALAMARRATDVYVVKGKRVVHFDMRGGGPDDDELLAHLLGPTGNLRAPVVRRDAGVDQRQLDVGQRGGARQEIEGLEDEADLAVAD
ncbi:MAG: hypothetical protein HUU28_00105, partial [Planctomycetaceae bacterium]|nr:hypothetical protein [Planctomycetaceae bacterium]